MGLFRNLIGPLFGGSETERHYEGRAGEAAGSFYNEPPPLPPFAEPYEEDLPYAEEVFEEPNIEVIALGGEISSDVEYITFNHDTGETIISFLEHGEKTKNAHIYSYSNIPYEEVLAIAEGRGPFPTDRHPYYQKSISVGQRVNFYIRNDHLDDLYDYKREENS